MGVLENFCWLEIKGEEIMKTKVRQSSLKICNYYSLTHIKKSFYIQSMKYVALPLIFLFSLNTFAMSLLDLKRASDSGNIDATYSLAGYYYAEAMRVVFYAGPGRDHFAERGVPGQSHRRLNNDDNIRYYENLSNAIHYYKKTAQMIEPNYSKVAPDNMFWGFMEKMSLASYNIIRNVLHSYFILYSLALDSNIDGNIDGDIIDTEDVLSNIRTTAIQCLESPFLSDRDRFYRTHYRIQQDECVVFLRFVEAVYPLEQQRIQMVQNCPAPLSKQCAKRKILNQIFTFREDALWEMGVNSREVLRLVLPLWVNY